MSIIVETISQIVRTHIKSAGEVTTCSKVVEQTCTARIASASNTLFHTISKELEAFRNRAVSTAIEVAQRNQLNRNICRIRSTYTELISGVGINLVTQDILRINLCDIDGVQTISQVSTSISQSKLFCQTFVRLNSQSLAIEFGNNLRSVSVLVELHVEFLQVVLDVERALLRNSFYDSRSQHVVWINIIVFIQEFCVVSSNFINLTNNLASVRTTSILQLQVTSSVVVDNAYLVTLTCSLLKEDIEATISKALNRSNSLFFTIYQNLSVLNREHDTTLASGLTQFRNVGVKTKVNLDVVIQELCYCTIFIYFELNIVEIVLSCSCLIVVQVEANALEVFAKQILIDSTLCGNSFPFRSCGEISEVSRNISSTTLPFTWIGMSGYANFSVRIRNDIHRETPLCTNRQNLREMYEQLSRPSLRSILHRLKRNTTAVVYTNAILNNSRISYVTVTFVTIDNSNERADIVTFQVAVVQNVIPSNRRTLCWLLDLDTVNDNLRIPCRTFDRVKVHEAPFHSNLP